MSEAKTKAQHDALLARGVTPNWHEKPPADVRSVEDAMQRAAQQREFLPRCVQVNVQGWDLVILADEVARLNALIAQRGD